MPTAKPLARPKPASGGARGGAPGRALQAKLEVGGAGDHFEREADHVARQVMGGGDASVAIPPTITPLGAQRKAMPGPTPKKEDDKKGAKVQRKPAASMPKVEEDKKPGKKAQRKAGPGAAGGTAPAGVESSIGRMQAGAGRGLDGGARGFMENRFGRDFSGVRVHSGSDAASAARALNARAFTVGNNVFFNAGEYRPHSASGRELIAHELTHTVQQAGTGGVAARKRIQRNGPPPRREEDEAPARTSTTFSSRRLEGGAVDTTDVNETRGTITLPVLALPSIANALKGTAGGLATPVAAAGRAIPAVGAPFTLGPVSARDTDSQAYQVWTEYARGNMKAGVRTKLGQMVEATPNIAPIQENGVPIYYLTFRSARVADRSNIFIGTLDELSDQDALLRPQWNPTGRSLQGRGNTLDADHFLELQIGGMDSAENMWLLKGSYNSAVGNRIKTNLENNLRTILTEIGSDETVPEGEKPQDVSEMKRRWTIRFSNVAQGGNFPGATADFWTQGQIRDGTHLDHLKIMNEQDLVRAGLRLEDGNAQPSQIKIFPSAAGGRMASVRLDSNGAVRPVRAFLYQNIWAEGGTYHGGSTDQEAGPLLTLNVIINKTARGTRTPIAEKRGTIDVLRSPRLGIAGYVSRQSIRSQFSSMEFTPLSPLTFADMDVSADGALVGTGNVLSSKAIFPNLNIPLVLYGDRVMMNFPIPVESLSLGPFTVTEAGVALGVGGEGFFVEGYAAFLVRGLGSGSVSAEMSEAGPRLAGTFDLDTDFLNPAQIAVTYDISTDALTASATLGVQQGQIPGVDSGTVTVTITRDNIDVTGTINLGGALAGTTITVGYTREQGVRIGADNIPLPFARLPAVQNATMSISAARNPESGVWSFTGSGQATLAVPGATGTINLSYRDGLVRMTAEGQVARGPASGTLNFTATNGAIDEEGNPVEGPPTDTITAWGRGSVTIQFGNILQGTAGIELTPDNRVILSGRIALPPVYDVFPRREYNRDLLRIRPPEFPIWGVSVAGVGVGIFAFVDARISFNAYVGPGQIRDAAIDAEMDLDHPENATVHGHGQFFVPAYAGLSLDVGGGLRARIAVAYAQGRVGLEGRLGIEADASASVDVDWSRAAGLSLTATFEANARPKFELLANASVTVGVDLLVTDVSHTFGPWERRLGEFGPDMELGVEFPVRWSEAQGLDLSLDNIVVRQPTLDARSLMDSVFDRLTA